MAKKVKKRKRGGATFPCPACGGVTRVMTTRRKTGGVMRTRTCLECEALVITQERQAPQVFINAEAAV